MELDYLNHSEQDLLQAVQDAESAVTELRRFAASFLLMQSRQSTPGTNTTTIASVKSTEEGWLLISLPVILPRRGEKDRARFLDEPLRAAIRCYCQDRALPKFQTCVLVYEHIYDAAYPRRRVTDHDNLELKHCQDVLEAAFLANDTASLCSVFQCSHPGEEVGTRIWILTPEQFGIWLSKHKTSWQKSQETGN